MADDHGVGVRTVRPWWSGAVLVCGKCLKRHEHGKDLKRGLRTELKHRQSTHPKRRRVRIIKIACIGLCPRRAVVIASAATLAADEVLLVEDTSNVAEAILRLLPSRRPVL